VVGTVTYGALRLSIAVRAHRLFVERNHASIRAPVIATTSGSIVMEDLNGQIGVQSQTEFRASSQQGDDAEQRKDRRCDGMNDLE
jgi:hypothetical protein